MVKKIVKPGLVLLVITVVAAALLGFVNEMTKEDIARVEAMAIENAKKEVLPSAVSFGKDKIDESENSIIQSYSEGFKSDNSTAGYAFSVVTKGFSTGLKLMIGIDEDGKVSGIKVVSHEETPGLGAKAKSDPEFTAQYKEKQSPIEVVKSDVGAENEIKAITGATITSKAITDAVNTVSEFYNDNIKGKGGTE